jgi:plasmid segregation protein ParM
MKGFINEENVNPTIELASIDNGYDSTKVYAIINGKEHRFKYRSKYEVSDDDLNKNNTMSFYYNGRNYIVGEGASMEDLDYDKTNSELHKICTYTALARLSNYIGCNFNLVVGYPLNIYSEGKDTFAEYLKTDELIETSIRYEKNIKEKKLFGVNECIVFPQGAGAVFCDSDKWRDKTVSIIDVGGQTVNGVVMKNLNIVRGTRFTEKLGMFILQNDIKKNLNSTYQTDIQEYQLEEIMKDKYYTKYGKKMEGSEEIIEETIVNHVKTIQNFMTKNKHNIEGSKYVLLIGEGLYSLNLISRT